MSNKPPISANLAFSKKEMAFIATVIILVMGYIITAFMSQTFAAILLLPVIIAPLIAIFFVKCLRCQLKTRNFAISHGVEKQGNTLFGKLMKYMGYVIYTFLFAILGWVCVLWLVEHFSIAL